MLHQKVSWPGLNVQSPDNVACLVSEGELFSFLMCTWLVTQTVVCLVLGCELA